MHLSALSHAGVGLPAVAHAAGGAARPLALDLNGTGTYLHWSFIEISVANLIVIAVMIVVFGAALLIRFPHKAGADLPPVEPKDDLTATAAAPLAGDERMWTARVRTRAAKLLPPGKLLPDRQPAYVSSWIYVFGVAALVALGIVIASGLALALGGSDWWHTNPVGHFFNSLHLWSVELFMAFIVIHLWGKFWMAAWRGRRAMTWITGVLAFLVSVVTCFTGYLSQQNFDSQWIATNGKDAFNATGIGAIWNAMNFGQMFMWHIVLMPIALLAIVGGHILMVRVRGVSHPLPTERARGTAARKAAAAADAESWRGPTRRYDILKEGTIAAVIVGALVAVMAGVLSSPNVPSLSIKTWGTVDPVGFVNTAATELDGGSVSASYGPPYNNGTGSVQQVGPVNWQKLFGITQPVDSAKLFVLDPLAAQAKSDPALSAALATYNSAPAAQQLTWATAYDKATAPGSTKMPFNGGDLTLPAAGPVPAMMAGELTMARSGALDSDLLAQRQFFGTDYTKPLLFIADGGYYNQLATNMHLTGDQWGVMNETGSYPGQPWLWLYQMWYHVSPFQNSANVDVWAVYLTGICTLLLLFVPFIPGLRDIPRVVPLYRLVWRSWYRRPGSSEHAATAAEPGHAVRPS
ncbi:MAG TPA: cytochrome b N-terminal domain-containing protein [Streptosporangiaceae bacterium]|nr:cytochrome b N-terminal domain-containing protein [Streptosporangiaceae bacterium]